MSTVLTLKTLLPIWNNQVSHSHNWFNGQYLIIFSSPITSRFGNDTWFTCNPLYGKLTCADQVRWSVFVWVDISGFVVNTISIQVGFVWVVKPRGQVNKVGQSVRNAEVNSCGHWQIFIMIKFIRSSRSP